MKTDGKTNLEIGLDQGVCERTVERTFAKIRQLIKQQLNIADGAVTRQQPSCCKTALSS